VRSTLTKWFARHLEAAHALPTSSLGHCPTSTTGGGFALRIGNAVTLASAPPRPSNRDELISARHGRRAPGRSAGRGPKKRRPRRNCCSSGGEGLPFPPVTVAAGCSPRPATSNRVAGEAAGAMGRPATGVLVRRTTTPDPERLPEVDARLQRRHRRVSGRRRDPGGAGHQGTQPCARRAPDFRLRAGSADGEGRPLRGLSSRHDRAGDHRQITAALGAAPSAGAVGPEPRAPRARRAVVWIVVRMQRNGQQRPHRLSRRRSFALPWPCWSCCGGRPDKAPVDVGRRPRQNRRRPSALRQWADGDRAVRRDHRGDGGGDQVCGRNRTSRTAMEGNGNALGVGAGRPCQAAAPAGKIGGLSRAGGGSTKPTDMPPKVNASPVTNLKDGYLSPGWRCGAEIQAAQGRHDEAVAMAREARCRRRRPPISFCEPDADNLPRPSGRGCSPRQGDEPGANRCPGANAEALVRPRRKWANSNWAASGRGPLCPADSSPAPTDRPRLGRSPTGPASSPRAYVPAMAGPRTFDTLVEGYGIGSCTTIRRRLSGDPVTDRAGMLAGGISKPRVFEQFTRFPRRAQPWQSRGGALGAPLESMGGRTTGTKTVGFMLFEADRRRTKPIYAGRFGRGPTSTAPTASHRGPVITQARGAAVSRRTGRVMSSFVDALDRPSTSMAATSVSRGPRLSVGVPQRRC